MPATPSFPPSEERRTHVLKVAVSPSERARLAAYAARRGRSVSEIVRLTICR